MRFKKLNSKYTENIKIAPPISQLHDTFHTGPGWGIGSLVVKISKNPQPGGKVTVILFIY